jgi:GABA permease
MQKRKTKEMDCVCSFETSIKLLIEMTIQGGIALNPNENHLKKDLKIRHITMISIGGVIGAGLFMGSGAIIHSAGPGSIISYALAGLIVIFVMRMLGEMASINPTSGSFSTYARDAIGSWAGYTIGWLYWFFWVIVIAIEATAGAANIQYWFPDIPAWLIFNWFDCNCCDTTAVGFS